MLQRLIYENPQLRIHRDPLGEFVRRRYKISMTEYTKQLVERNIKEGLAQKELTGAKIAVFYIKTRRHLRVRHILFEDVQKARSAWYKLKTGADFGKLAREMSRADEMLPGGSRGELIPFSREEYPYRDDVQRYGQAFIDVAYKTAQGRFSGVFKSKVGWHIIKVLESGSSMPNAKFSALKDDVMKEVQDDKNGRWMIFRPIWIRLEAEKKGVAIKMPKKFD